VAYFLLCLLSNFSHRTSALLSFFVLEAEPVLLKQLRLGIPKSVGAQWSACFIFPTQILAVEKNPASAPAQVLAES
jgi:hypothetical protein